MTSNAPKDGSSYGTILLATDFSGHSNAAMSCAMELAKVHGARLAFVHAVDGRSIQDVPLKLQDDIDRKLTALLDATKGSGIESIGHNAAGKPWEVIAAAQKTYDAELIIVGAKGHGTFPRLHLGSTADRVVRTSEVPVLCVHHGDEGKLFSLRTIVVAVDFSDGSCGAVEAARRLAANATWPVRIVLLHAFHIPIEYSMGVAAAIIGEDPAKVESESRAALEKIAGPLRSQGHEVDVVCREGYPASVISDVSAEEEADVIALGTHGRSGLHHVLIGSIAERVLHHASCPVLTVRHARHADSPTTPSTQAASSTVSTTDGET
ncbi:MAG: universal stress protein [Planctomycetota bacterium]